MSDTPNVENGGAPGQSDEMLSNDDAKCKLRFLMVNGESFTREESVSSTVATLKQSIIDHPPEALKTFLRSLTPSISTGPKSVDELRILHLGKFLDDSTLLKDCKFETRDGEHTTVHIAIKIATIGADEESEKKTGKPSACCAVM